MGFFLKIISEGEIPEHFKKGMVKICFTDNIKVIGAQAFLTGRGPALKVSIDASQELRLKLLHPRCGKKYGRIILGHQGITGNNGLWFPLRI